MAKVICLFLCLLTFSFVSCQFGLLNTIADSVSDVHRSKRDVDTDVPSCPTVNKLPARCVDLETECPRLYQVAKANRNNPRFANTIKQLQCGSRNIKNPLVCCPVDWIPKAQVRTKPPPQSQPAVTNPPVTKPPVTKPPVMKPPVTKPSVTKPPVTEEPVTKPPVTEEPVTQPPENTCKSLNSGYLPGLCVTLVDCPSLYKQAIERSKDPEVRNELYRIHCGWADNDPQKPQICCPIESVATPAPTRASDEIPQDDAPTRDDFVDNLPSPPDCGSDRLYLPRVVGGRKARNGMFPWMALLGYRRRSDVVWFCGGSLISTRHVLTAAHCIHKNEKTLFQVKLGELDLSRDDDGATPIDVPIKKMVIHEHFVPEGRENDIGMLTLATDVQYTNLIKPICMPMRPELRANSFEDYRPFLAGWGQIKYAGNSSDYLQFIQIPVTNTAECSKIYKKADHTFRTLDNRSLCAGYKQGKMDSCSGDSGGPLMQPDIDPVTKKSIVYQTGIISFGKSCGAAGYPGVYVRVTEYIPWIVKQTTGKIVS